MRYVYKFVLVFCLIWVGFVVPIAAADSTTISSGHEDVITHTWDWGGGESGEAGAGRKQGFAVFGQILTFVFGGAWDLMGITMPVLGITYRQFWFGSLVIGVALWIWRKLSGNGVQRSGSTNNPRISDRRKDDEF